MRDDLLERLELVATHLHLTELSRFLRGHSVELWTRTLALDSRKIGLDELLLHHLLLLLLSDEGVI